MYCNTNTMKVTHVIFIIALFIPEFFKSNIPIIYWFLEGIRIGGALYIIYKYVSLKESSYVFKYVIAFHLVILFATILNRSGFNTFKTLINVSFSNIGVICFFELLFKKNCRIALQTFSYSLKLLVLSNFVFMILYPDGIFITTLYNSDSDAFRDITTYFLSFKNRLIMWFLPLMACLYVIGEKKLIVFYNTIIFAQLIICKSVTSIFVFVFFHFICILCKMNIIKKISLKIVYFFVFFIFLAFIYFQIQTYFEKFLIDYLGKNVELQGRTFIWALAIDLINSNFLLGYGNANNGSIIEWNGYLWYSHNLILDVLIQGGVIALLIFSKLHWEICKEKATTQLGKYYQNIVYISLIVLLLDGMFESYLNYPQYFLLLSMCSTITHPCLFKL